MALLLLNLSDSTAQETDTLRWAKALNSVHKYNKSAKLLQPYYANHSNDLYAGWLFASALHQTKKYNKSQEVYTQLLRLFPENDELRLDFANKLAEAGEFDEAVGQLNQMSDDLPEDYVLAVQKTRAKIYYWQGEYDKALNGINQALIVNNNDPEAIHLKNDISFARSNWLIIDAKYSEDDQPLQILTPSIKAIFYGSAKLSGGLNLISPLFSKTSGNFSGQWLSGFVQLRFSGPKIGVRLDAGAIKFPSFDYDWTAAIRIDKTLLKHMKLGLVAERKPYLATEASLDKKVMQTTFSTYLLWDDPNGWMGNASYDLNRFAAFDNKYYTVSAWLMSPALKAGVFSFRIGYGFNYSDSDEDTFVAKEPLDDILDNWDSTAVIAGVYDPFFSPNKQSIHSAILMVNISPAKKLSMNLTANYGFLATAQTPYLFLNKKKNGKPFIDRQFYDDRYHPLQIDGKISYQLSPAFSLSGYYTYQRTNFYAINLFGLTAILHF
ncbi:MAG: tetratricopeptide repeat protein [Bacteroidales bacterium]|nr:tetratricopeptide repeat protein [Bacteroidales bacterium]